MSRKHKTIGRSNDLVHNQLLNLSVLTAFLCYFKNDDESDYDD